ncbi:hypothetical protein Tco_1419694 [Tanacetum coccineum]
MNILEEMFEDLGYIDDRLLFTHFRIHEESLDEGNGYSLKDKNEAKSDKTEHENGKSVKSQSRSQRRVKPRWKSYEGLLDRIKSRAKIQKLGKKEILEGQDEGFNPPHTRNTTSTPLFKLQAEKEEQARLAKEKAEKDEEANISWDNVQVMIEADRLLGERLQAREKEELTDEEKGRLFIELLEKRKKHFTALRAQEKRNKPPTKAQKKSTMSTYMKHMVGYKQSLLKNKSFVKIQKLFDKAMTKVNMFVDMDTHLVKESSKKDETELVEDDAKVDDDQEEARMKEFMNIVPDEKEVAIDAIPLATKPPCIVDWKIIKEGKITQF